MLGVHKPTSFGKCRVWCGNPIPFNPTFRCYFNFSFSVSIAGKSVSEALILESVNPQYDMGLFIEFHEKYKFRTRCVSIGKSLSEALIFASNNPQNVNRLFIVHENCKLRTPAEHVVYTNYCFCCVLTFRTILVLTQHVLQMLQASEKDLPVQILF